jgi:DnaA family protein
MADRGAVRCRRDAPTRIAGDRQDQTVRNKSSASLVRTPIARADRRNPLSRIRNPTLSQLPLDLLQPAPPTLANFVAGRNGEAVDVLARLARGPGFDAAPARIVYLWGEPGSGRSHLLAALAGRPGAYAWRADSAPEAPGLALVDDVETLDAAAQVALFNRLNAVRAQADAACVATGPLPPSKLALREDLRTRLAWGLVLQLHPLSDAEKSAALRAHAASTGLELPDDVLAALLARLPRDMRTLVAALDALDAYALARKRPLTLTLLREWLQLRDGPPPPA